MKHTHRLAGFALTALLVVGAYAQAPQAPGRPATDVRVINTPLPVSTGDTYRFVGFSVETPNGAVGFAAMNAACQSAFGGNARMCTTKEVVQTPNLQEVLANADTSVSGGWAHPVIVSEVFNPNVGVSFPVCRTPGR